MTDINPWRSSSAADGEGPPPNDLTRRLLLIGGLGFAVGVVFVLFLATLFWSLGWLHFGAAPGCPEAKATCPPTPAFMPACPTCAVEFVTLPPPTATPTPTPDIAATATAACEAFLDDFPGTPCPSPQPTSAP